MLGIDALISIWAFSVVTYLRCATKKIWLECALIKFSNKMDENERWNRNDARDGKLEFSIYRFVCGTGKKSRMYETWNQIELFSSFVLFFFFFFAASCLLFAQLPACTKYRFGFGYAPVLFLFLSLAANLAWTVHQVKAKQPPAAVIAWQSTTGLLPFLR